MAELHFECSLEIKNAREGESHRLLIFGSRDSHSHACFNETVPIKQNTFEFTYPVLDAPPAWLHFVLFSNCPDKDNIMCQSILAWGNLKWPGEGTANLLDVKCETQAVLRVNASHRVKKTEPSTCGIHASAASEKMINRVRETYETLKHDTNSYLNWVVTPMGKVPVLPFVASVSSILTDSPSDHERGEEFLKHQFEIAGSNTGLKSLGWAKCSHPQRARWLAEAATLIPRAMVYQQDTVRTSQTTDSSADQWVHLLSFPEPNIAGFDCEDSAILVLELLYMIQHIPFASKLLQQVQEFTKGYTACFIFGTILIDGTYSPHAYAALLDSNFLDGTEGKYLPAILFEGTARLGGSWMEDQSSSHVNESFSMHSSLSSTLGRDKGYARVMRGEASMGIVKDNGLYGPVFGIISGDHNAGSAAVHLIAHPSNSNTVGVSANDLYSYSSKVEFTTAVRYSNKDSEFIDLCNELPRSYIPHVSTSKLQYHTNKGAFRVDIHYETFMRREVEVQEAVQKAKGKYRVSMQVVHITDQLKVQQLWFDDEET